MYPSHVLRDSLRRTLSPPDRPPPHPDADAGPGAPAAVLVPLVAADGGDEGLRLLLTRRTDTLSRHAGEISFPGGLADDGEPPSRTALREAEEEIGLDPGSVDVLGSLAPVHTRVTGILVVPVVGLVSGVPALTPNPAEIAEVLMFPMGRLREVGEERPVEWEGRTYRTHVFELEGHVIWGATARILQMLLDAAAEAERAGGSDA